MKLTQIFAASVLAATLPVAASAATMVVNGSATSITSAEPYVLSLSETTPNYTIGIFGSDGEEGPLAFRRK